jgi:phage terminase large subunit-like protein
MSTKIDLTTVLACFPEEDGSFLIKCWGFVPQETARRRSDEDRVDYVLWSKDDQEFMKLSPGYEIDPETVETFLRKLNDDFDVQELTFDPAYLQSVRGHLTDEGFPVAIMPQGWVTQSPALATLEGAIYGRLVKWDSPVLRWCMDNVKINTDPAGNRKMDKGRSRDRIDLACCLWMAVARASSGDGGLSWFESDEAEEAFGDDADGDSMSRWKRKRGLRRRRPE